LSSNTEDNVNVNNAVVIDTTPKEGVAAATGVPTTTALSREEELKMQYEWLSVYDDIDSCKEIAIQDYEIIRTNDHKNSNTNVVLDVPTFVANFLQDDAPYSLSNKYMHEIVGGTEISVTEWTKTAAVEERKGGGGVQAVADNKLADKSASLSTTTTLTRTIEYTQPVNAPMAPPTARARKEQTLRVYGNHGFIVESETYVVGVPKSECFYVKDIMRIEQEDTNSSDGGAGAGDDDDSSSTERRLLLTVTFEVVFVKSTWFEELITRTTRSEVKKFITNMAEYIIDKCSRSGCIIPVLLPTSPVLPIVASGASVPIVNENDHNDDDAPVAAADTTIDAIAITITTDSVEVVIEAAAAVDGAGKEATIVSSTNDVTTTLPATATGTALTTKIKKKVLPHNPPTSHCHLHHRHGGSDHC